MFIEERRAEWNKLMKQIEDARYYNDMSLFYKLVQKATRIKKKTPPM